MSDDRTVTAAVVRPLPIPPQSDIWGRKLGAYGALFVTVMVFGLFVGAMVVLFVWEDKQGFGGMTETIRNLTFLVVGFWVGSSLGAKQQAEAIATKLNQPDPQPTIQVR